MTRLVGWSRGGRLAILFAGVVVLGCGGRDPNELPTVAASGTVTYQGKPVNKGTVHFFPEKGHPASGAIQDGKFTLSTYQLNDGAVAGKHQVGVEVTEDVPAKDGDTKVKYIVPEKFANPDTSKITVEIPPGGNKDIKIDVK